jgi:hypothetical protein
VSLLFDIIVFPSILIHYVSSRYAHRSFGVAHWRAVQQKLRALRKNMASAVDALNRNKGAATVAAN